MQMNNKNPTTDSIVEEIIEEFNFFDDWEDKYAHIIDMGRKLEKMETELMVEDTKLRGCQSTVYFHSQKENNEKIHFKACSDAAIVQGLIALLLRVYNNRKSKFNKQYTIFRIKTSINLPLVNQLMFQKALM